MNRIRLALLVAATAVAVVLVGLIIVSNSRFQTWAVHRALAARPELAVTVREVDAGLGQVVLRDVRWTDGDAVFTAPLIEAELSVLTAAFSDRYELRRVQATGWRLSFVPPVNSGGASPPARGPAAPPTAAQIPAAAAVATGAALQAFAGVFGQLHLPVDIALDQALLEGTVDLPSDGVRSTILIRGGGLKSGSEGRFDVRAAAGISEQIVQRVSVEGALLARMDTPRTFDHFALNVSATAQGPRLARELTLRSEVTAARTASGESYSATLRSEERPLVTVRAEFPAGARRLTGTWQLDMRDSDIASFTLGHPLPSFDLAGGGRFATDATFTELHAEGKVSGAVSRLEALSAHLAALPETRFAATFDLAHRDSTLQVEQFAVSLEAPQPVVAIHALQPFAFNPATRELVAQAPAGDLFRIHFAGFPVAWAESLLTGVKVVGGVLQGDVIAIASAGGMAVRSPTALTIQALTIAPAGREPLPPVDIGFTAGADYTPGGWQAEIGGLSVRRGTTQLLLLDAKAGQLNGNGQALKATGKLSADVPALLRQIEPETAVPLSQGRASIEFVASFNEKKELHAKVAVQELAAMVAGAVQPLPSVAADLRADITADGEIALNAPLVIEQAGRNSDLSLVGTIGAERKGARVITGNVSSNHLVLDDARILAALLPDSETPAAGASPPVAPPWAGLEGSLALQLKRVVMVDTFEVTNVDGRLRLEAGVVKLETVKAGLGENGQALLDGELRFGSPGAPAYGFAANVNLREFNPGPLLQSINPGQPPAVEGVFEVASKLTANAASLEQIPAALAGEFQLTSKGGIFRGLPVAATNLAEASSRIAAFITSAGAALGALTGRRDYLDVANKAEAVGELARSLSAIKFDQLSARLVRDQAMNTRIQNFTVIAPELRLAGGGVALHTPGTPVTDDALALEFTLLARGRQGELLRYLGLIDAQVDDLGYSPCTVPVKIGGTIGQPDATEFSQQITALALEKSGLTERAAELLGRIRGSGK